MLETVQVNYILGENYALRQATKLTVSFIPSINIYWNLLSPGHWARCWKNAVSITDPVPDLVSLKPCVHDKQQSNDHILKYNSMQSDEGEVQEQWDYKIGCFHERVRKGFREDVTASWAPQVTATVLITTIASSSPLLNIYTGLVPYCFCALSHSIITVTA